MQRIDLTGQRFGMLVVESCDGVGNDRLIHWTCRCDCGNVSHPDTAHLRRGTTRSCGCQKRNVGTKNPAWKHGAATGGKVTSEYSTWARIVNRCENPRTPDYKEYGGRGIRMCRRWRESFEAFLEDMGPKPEGKTSIDRIKNDGDYEPGNCRWSTPQEQANNRKSSVKVWYQGELVTIAELSRRIKVDYEMLRRRLHRGMTIEEIIREMRVIDAKTKHC